MEIKKAIELVKGDVLVIEDSNVVADGKYTVKQVSDSVDRVTVHLEGGQMLTRKPYATFIVE